MLLWVHNLGVGTLRKKPRKGLRKDGTKYLMQYKWRCTFETRTTCVVYLALRPYKLPKIQQIIEHYSTQKLKS